MRIVLALIFALAPPAASPSPLRIAAAASFTDVLPGLIAAFKDPPAEATFDATSRLAKQIESGAPFDVFISADVEWADTLATEKLLVATQPIAGNQLIVVVPKSVKSAPKDFTALAAYAKKLALAGENVPAGRYAKQALEKAGVWPQVAPHVVRAEHVRAALKWVSLGEADAALVYATDIALDRDVQRAFAVDPSLHEPIVYSAGVVSTSHQRALAQRFLSFLTSSAGQKRLLDAGFSAAPAVKP